MNYKVRKRDMRHRSSQQASDGVPQAFPELPPASDESPKKRKTSWLTDHWSQALVLCLSLVTAACYLVGRAKLLGWYDAAGIPQLMFSWSAQDLVIKGLVESETWLLLLAGVAGFACLSAAMDIATAGMRRLLLERSRLQLRGEACDRLGLRKRMAREARRLRKAKDARALQATRHWQMLEKRGVFRKAPKKSLRKPTHWASSDAYKSLLLLPILFLLMMAYLLVNAFYAWSYRNGARSYWMEYAAATNNWPPSRVAGGWKPKETDRVLLEELAKGGRERLREYAYVHVRRLEADPKDDPRSSDQPICGWMMQASGNVLVLLNASGLLVVNFSDSPYRWSSVPHDACATKSLE
ncbi:MULTISPECIES: hypothetical protein [unclassified Variovorax]|uniref:hypothetical protein n=1 Tax=unclassified Variovorax TaxID=663243 RepID=UPI003F4554E9